MDAKLDNYGCPLCPDCNITLNPESAGNRDRETMGGYSVEYFKCEDCKEHFEVIDSSFHNKTIYPCSP